jgi:hypothetical protein
MRLAEGSRARQTYCEGRGEAQRRNNQWAKRARNHGRDHTAVAHFGLTFGNASEIPRLSALDNLDSPSNLFASYLTRSANKSQTGTKAWFVSAARRTLAAITSGKLSLLIRITCSSAPFIQTILVCRPKA